MAAEVVKPSDAERDCAGELVFRRKCAQCGAAFTTYDVKRTYCHDCIP
jgi:transcriptional regulator NrdR family protein